MTETRRHCPTCRFVDHEECHRHPPVVISANRENISKPETVYPKVGFHDWCGEWDYFLNGKFTIDFSDMEYEALAMAKRDVAREALAIAERENTDA